MPREQDTDPRVVRTRKLIQDAFMTIAQKKDFESITIKDIAAKATINRATFYAHYVDKYQVLDEMITKVFNEMISNRIYPGQEFSEETGRELILLVYEYHIYAYEKCRINAKSIASHVEQVVKSQLQEIIIQLLSNRTALKSQDPGKIEMAATMIGAAIYSSSQSYFMRKNQKNPDDLVADTLSFIISGMKAIL